MPRQLRILWWTWVNNLPWVMNTISFSNGTICRFSGAGIFRKKEWAIHFQKRIWSRHKCQWKALLVLIMEVVATSTQLTAINWLTWCQPARWMSQTKPNFKLSDSQSITSRHIEPSNPGKWGGYSWVIHCGRETLRHRSWSSRTPKGPRKVALPPGSVRSN